MNCGRCRELISARLDGELSDLPVAAMDHHLAGCPACREFEHQAAVLNRQMRVRSARPVTDRTGELVVAMTRAGSGWRWDLVRALLVGLAAMEIGNGLVAMIGGGDGGVPVHVAREVGGFGLALGIGFLVAAIRPARIAGLLPVVSTLVVTSLLAGAIDVMNGRVDIAAEMHHLLEVVAVLALWSLTRPGWHPFVGRTVASP